MSDMIQNFIMTRFPIPGLAAYSVHSPVAALESQCLSKSLYGGTADQMLSHVIKCGRVLLPSGGRPVNYCWTFEAHQVYVAVRADGLSLALLMENNVNVQPSTVRDVLEGFLDLQA
jgi:hypothetical protein